MPYPEGTSPVPAIVLIGAQWGDEGKGKVNRSVGLPGRLCRPLPGWQQRGPHGRSRGWRKLCPAPDALRGAVARTARRSLATAWWSIRGAAGRDRRAAAQGVSCDQLLLSADAHLIMPYHRALDRVVERYLGAPGSGPPAAGSARPTATRSSRVGIRVQDLSTPASCARRWNWCCARRTRSCSRFITGEAIDLGGADGVHRLRQRLRRTSRTPAGPGAGAGRGARRAARGRTGDLLDVDHGTYPFVTSSSPTAGGACVGIGVRPTRITQVIGVIKAYTTRVGSGPFPTELFDDRAVRTCARWGWSTGTTTGRERRCGWFDTVVARYSVRVNGITDLVVTKLDVLTGLPRCRSVWGTRSMASAWTACP